MAYNLEAILKKRKWTGEELGKLLIYSLIDSYKQTRDGSTDPTPILPEERMRQMIRSLQGKKDDLLVYNRYVELNRWIMQHFAVAFGTHGRVTSALERIIGIIATASAAEDNYLYLEQLPLIMTQEQYDITRAAKIEERLSDEEGERWQRSLGLFGLFKYALGKMIKQLEEHPRRANPLKAIARKYKQQPITSQRILSRYNEAFGEGYYTLPNGRRSDEMEREEWQAALETEYLRTHPPITIDGEPASFMETMQHYNEERAIANANEIFTVDADLYYEYGREGIAKRQDEQNLRSLLKGDSTVSAETRSSFNCTWHYYEEPPEDLTKWDIIRGSMEDFFPILMGEEIDTYTEQVNDFQREFPELFDAVVAEIDRIYFRGKKGLAATPIEEWATTSYTQRELYDMDFFGFKGFIEANHLLFDGNHRAANGIAILYPGAFASPFLLDEQGHFLEPEPNNTISIICGLEQFTPKNESYLERIGVLERDLATLKNEYYHLLGYEKALELIGDYIGLPELTIFTMGTSFLLNRLVAVNDLIAGLYYKIKEGAYKDESAKEEKLQVLLDYFAPVDWREIKTSLQGIEAAKEMLHDNMRAFALADGKFLDFLVIPPWEDE